MVSIECSDDEAAIRGVVKSASGTHGKQLLSVVSSITLVFIPSFHSLKDGSISRSNNCSLFVFWSVVYDHIDEFIAVQIIRKETGIHSFTSSIIDTKNTNISPSPDSTVNWDSCSNRINPITTRRAKSQQSKSPNFVPCSTPGGSRHITQGTRTRTTNPFHRTTACREFVMQASGCKLHKLFSSNILAKPFSG